MAGQTLAEIRGLLAGLGTSPRHRFGQNFLIDLNLMRKIAAAARLSPDDVVLEVGPGTGSLTEILLETGCRVVTVEIDRDFQRLLAKRLGDQPRFTLISGDALASKHRLNPEMLAALTEKPPGPRGEIKLVANLPYQIATPLIMELLTGTPRIASMTCTIQKEVGERIAAPPCCADYGPVSVMAQTLAEIETIAVLPPEVFWPRPQVDSIALHLVRRADEDVPVNDIPALRQLVQTAFRQRRKMLRGALKSLEIDDLPAVLQACGISPEGRAESVALSEWHALQRALSARSL